MGFTQLDKNKNDIMADAGEEAVARRQAAAGGRIRANDAMEPEARTGPRPYQAAVITLSDQGARASGRIFRALPSCGGLRRRAMKSSKRCCCRTENIRSGNSFCACATSGGWISF